MKYTLISTAIIVALIITSIIIRGRNKEYRAVIEDGEIEAYSSDSEKYNKDNDKVDENPSKIYVHICGEISNEGVYEVDEGTRVYELIEIAGGLTKDASSENINQARVLKDGEQITIYGKDAVDTESGGMVNGLININTSSIEKLCEIPGIGEGRANDIVTYREDNGGFSDITDIMKVPGIKQATYDKLKDYITIY